jgi:hypothetical protein
LYGKHAPPLIPFSDTLTAKGGTAQACLKKRKKPRKFYRLPRDK